MRRSQEVQRFAEYLKAERSRAGFSQAMVAALTGDVQDARAEPISSSYLALLESGGRDVEVSARKLIGLAAVYGVSVQRLIDNAPVSMQGRLRNELSALSADGRPVIDPPRGPVRRDTAIEQDFDEWVAGAARDVNLPFDPRQTHRRTIRVLLWRAAVLPAIEAVPQLSPARFWHANAGRAELLSDAGVARNSVTKALVAAYDRWAFEDREAIRAAADTLAAWSYCPSPMSVAAHFKGADIERRWGFNAAPAGLVSDMRSVQLAGVLLSSAQPGQAAADPELPDAALARFVRNAIATDNPETGRTDAERVAFVRGLLGGLVSRAHGREHFKYAPDSPEARAAAAVEFLLTVPELAGGGTPPAPPAPATRPKRRATRGRKRGGSDAREQQ